MVQNMWLQLCSTKVVRSLFTSLHDHTFTSFVTNGHLMIFFTDKAGDLKVDELDNVNK